MPDLLEETEHAVANDWLPVILLRGVNAGSPQFLVEPVRIVRKSAIEPIQDVHHLISVQRHAYRRPRSCLSGGGEHFPINFDDPCDAGISKLPPLVGTDWRSQSKTSELMYNSRRRPVMDNAAQEIHVCPAIMWAYVNKISITWHKGGKQKITGALHKSIRLQDRRQMKVVNPPIRDEQVEILTFLQLGGSGRG